MSSVHELMAAMEQAIRSIQWRHKTQQHRPVSKSRRALWNVPRISPNPNGTFESFRARSVGRSVAHVNAVGMVAAAQSQRCAVDSLVALAAAGGLYSPSTHRVLTVHCEPIQSIARCE